jgi:hypothetical protein
LKKLGFNVSPRNVERACGTTDLLLPISENIKRIPPFSAESKNPTVLCPVTPQNQEIKMNTHSQRTKCSDKYHPITTLGISIPLNLKTTSLLSPPDTAVASRAAAKYNKIFFSWAAPHSVALIFAHLESFIDNFSMLLAAGTSPESLNGAAPMSQVSKMD